jgi:predicted amidohydrolase
MKTHATVRIAAAQYPIAQLEQWGEYRSKLERWVGEAAAAGAELLVFPEYAPMELASIFERRKQSDRRSRARHTLGPLPVSRAERRERPSIEREIAVIQPLLRDFQLLHAELAERYRLYILAGSFPVHAADRAVHHTACLFAPDGTMGCQDKIVLTRWERECSGITGGSEVRVFDTRFGPVGIAICYDIEFPLIARRQAEASARIILAPCCTPSLRGYHRIRIGARARALENQAYVVLSPTVGEAPWATAIDVNVGSAGIFAPPDLGPREDGVLAEGPRVAGKVLCFAPRGTQISRVLWRTGRVHGFSV